MTVQIWSAYFEFFVFAAVVLAMKRWLYAVPTWSCRVLAAIGLLGGIIFFAWTTRVLGQEVRRENPYKVQIVERYNMLRQATNREDVRMHVTELRTLLRTLSLELPGDVSTLDTLASAPTQGYYDSIQLDARVADMAKHVTPEGLLRQQVRMRVYSVKETTFFALTGLVLLMFLAGFLLERRHTAPA